MIFIFESCNQRTNKKDNINSANIISLIIDSNAIALPIPPLPDKNQIKLSQETIDSIKNVKLKIGIYPVMKPVDNQNFELGQLKSDYTKIVNSILFRSSIFFMGKRVK